MAYALNQLRSHDNEMDWDDAKKVQEALFQATGKARGYYGDLSTAEFAEHFGIHLDDVGLTRLSVDTSLRNMPTIAFSERFGMAVIDATNFPIEFALDQGKGKFVSYSLKKIGADKLMEALYNLATTRQPTRKTYDPVLQCTRHGCTLQKFDIER